MQDNQALFDISHRLLPYLAGTSSDNKPRGPFVAVGRATRIQQLRSAAMLLLSASVPHATTVSRETTCTKLSQELFARFVLALSDAIASYQIPVFFNRVNSMIVGILGTVYLFRVSKRVSVMQIIVNLQYNDAAIRYYATGSGSAAGAGAWWLRGSSGMAASAMKRPLKKKG